MAVELLVPGRARCFVSLPDQNGDPTDWVALPHTVKYEFAADVEEATELRTSDTDNRKVAACGGATSYTMTISSALCNSDWLYAYLLEDETDPTSGLNLWFYLPHSFVPGTDTVPAGITNDSVGPADLASTQGPLLKGIVQAPGIAFDNDASDPTVVEWTVKVQQGPYLPAPASYGSPPRPLAYTQA